MKPILILIGEDTSLGEEIESVLSLKFQIVRYPTLPELAQVSSIQFNEDSKKPLFKGAGLVVDSRLRRVEVDGVIKRLSELEFSLLCFLIERADRVMSRDQILNEVWGVDTYVVDRVVDSHIRSIRRKLGRYKDYIVTVYGGGYRFNPDAYPFVIGAEPLKKAA